VTTAAVTARTTAPGPHTRPRRWASGFRERDTWWAYTFLLPWLFGFVVFTAGPMVASAVLSFTDYSVIQTTHNVGLANYRSIASDPYVVTSLKNSLYMTALWVPSEMGLALLLASMLARISRLGGFFRTVFYLPVMTPTVANGSMYLLHFNGSYGLVDRALALVGVTGPAWQTDPTWIKPGIVVMLVWQVGNSTVLYLAAIKGVPQQLYEAASMDGASKVRQFFNITLPMISPALFFVLIIDTLAALNQFTTAYTAFFNSGNNSQTNSAALFYAIYLFQQAFRYFNMGFASAMAWVLFGISLAITAINILGTRRFVFYQGEARK
jgi:multiple sugar transport system permease protein